MKLDPDNIVDKDKKFTDDVKLDQNAPAEATFIRPAKGWMPVNLREVWTFRELLYFLVWRDVKVRYKQTIFGFAWSILQPFLMMLVFTLFFGILAKVPSQGIPYPLFTYTALLPWTMFANAINRASNCLVSENNLIQKVYFPRLLLPLSSIISPLLDFLIAFVVLIGLMIYYSYFPDINFLWMPAFLLLELLLALGVGLWLSAVNVEYRDVGFATPFLIQLWLFASPVIYSSDFVPPQYQVAYGLLNPMSGILEGFRWSLLGTKPPGMLLLVSTMIILAILVSGLFYFRRREKAFADVV
jgi:lipopolysaccharide transport system permease protein